MSSPITHYLAGRADKVLAAKTDTITTCELMRTFATIDANYVRYQSRVSRYKAVKKYLRARTSNKLILDFLTSQVCRRKDFVMDEYGSEIHKSEFDANWE